MFITRYKVNNTEIHNLVNITEYTRTNKDNKERRRTNEKKMISPKRRTSGHPVRHLFHLLYFTQSFQKLIYIPVFASLVLELRRKIIHSKIRGYI